MKREWDAFWYWRDKPVAERGKARNILKAASVQIVDLVSRSEDPPDCEATLDGKFSGVEVTELVHRPTFQRSIKATREREAGGEPKRPEVLFFGIAAAFYPHCRRALTARDGLGKVVPTSAACW
jgi:hypothetical protein